jgi:anti-anti-sigma factor
VNAAESMRVISPSSKSEAGSTATPPRHLEKGAKKTAPLRHMDICEEHTGDITIVEVKGRIDSNTAKPFGDRLNGLINAGRRQIVVDLKSLVYISGAGFRALLMAGRMAEECKGSLVLCSLSNEVQELFELGAFNDLFTIYASREEGLTKLA